MSPRHRRQGRGFPRRALLFLAIGALLWAVDAYRDRVPLAPEAPASSGFPSAKATATESSAGGGEQAILEAFRDRRSGFFVEVEGEVSQLLRDDTEGSRHQRFILRLSGSHTVLVSHNIDLAPRAPAREGDRIALRGKYEWNERGGVLHWTHHDPQSRRPGGWIRLRGDVFQ